MMKEMGRKKNYFDLILWGGVEIGERLEEKIASPYLNYLP